MLALSRSNQYRGIMSSGNKIKIIFEWRTEAGPLGTFYGTEEILIKLEVEATIGVDHFKLLSGDLPPFVSLLSDGTLYGVVPQNLDESLEYHFTVQAVDNQETVIEREFSLEIRQLISDVTWITPEGTLGTMALGQVSSERVRAESELQ